MRKNQLYFLILSLVSCLFNTNQAFSQTESTEKFGIEEVIVTAQKRAENSQDIPIAISAFSEDVIKKTRMYTLDDIAQLTPSFLVGQHTPTQPELSIRGIASTDREAGSDRPGLRSVARRRRCFVRRPRAAVSSSAKKRF